MDYSINPLLKNESENGSSDEDETISRTTEIVGTNDSDSIRELVRRPHNPADKYHFSYIIFYLLGMTTLLPWNFLMTAEDVSKKIIFFITFSFKINFVLFSTGCINFEM